MQNEIIALLRKNESLSQAEIIKALQPRFNHRQIVGMLNGSPKFKRLDDKGRVSQHQIMWKLSIEAEQEDVSQFLKSDSA